MMRSTGTKGFTRPGSPPARSTALRIAARSTTAGTPVKSCIRTRPGLNAMSWAGPGQVARAGEEPGRAGGDALARHIPGARSAKQVLEQDPHGVRQPSDVADPLVSQPR